ncbi:chemotaxis protein CheD [uncultured Desulfuromonas sp.]|uniref:chemotaxis protein CheD n=1 Tax=uncultured Desulfuromonas sp. TaxID=181013 RepID=UPI00260A9363|nr:chemotaxis protein CheD [uncultured Desulfuromonas sp.]
MRVEERGRFKRIIIEPGEYYVSDQEVVISTLLGSCVSACLYDPQKKIVGMNHFLLSNRRYARNMPITISEAGRYGTHAMELLINEMIKLGARRENLKAKAFGGGSLLHVARQADNFCCVGEVNGRFIHEFLDNEGIPLVAADLGGNSGRVIHYSASDFSVYARKIHRERIGGLVKRDRQFWESKIKEQETTTAQPDLWL